MQKLYKRDNTGATRVWWAEIEDAYYRLNSGQLDGKIVTSSWTHCPGKNIGRSNETTSEEQCEKEVDALYEKKLKRGYTAHLKYIDQVKAKMIGVMLAHKWEDHSHKIKYPVYSQPKLDGIRCIARADGLWSRKGEPILSVPHIAEPIMDLCKEHNVIFDGELYNHELKDDFNKIASLVRRQKTDDKHSADVRALVQYHIYDLVLPESTFSERFDRLGCDDFDFPHKYVKLLIPQKVKSLEQLDTLYGEYVENGYEGQMVRTDSLYEFKRTASLLKRKEFQDEEFEILDIVEGRGNRSGMAGAAILKLDKKRTFNAAIMGTDEYRRKILLNPQKIIGLQATVKYFHKTPDGVPRFPVVKTIHE